MLASGRVPDVARAVTIESGDLIVAARGVATDVLLATESLLGAYVSLDLYLVRPDSTKVDPQYLVAFLTLPATQSFFAASKQGSSLARLPKEALEKMEVPLPSIDVQRLIAGLACSFQEETMLLKKLSELNSVLAREVVARAFNAAAMPTRKEC
jgi:restriction endonuclease S subunit